MLGSKVEAAWSALQAAVGALVAASSADDAYVIAFDPVAPAGSTDGAFYVQWVAQGEHGVHLEAVSNPFLPAELRLPNATLGLLVELGWSVPEEGAPLFHTDLDRSRGDEVAALVVATLRQAFGVPHPAFLTAWGWRDDDALDVTLLGVHPLAGSASGAGVHGGGPDDGGDGLRGQVLRTLAEGLRVAPSDVACDDDGDFPIRTGSAVVFVRPLPDLEVVSVFSPVLLDVDDSDALRRQLDDLQSSTPFVRLDWQEGVVTARVEVNAAPYQPEHLDSAIVLLMQLADDVDDALHEQFGGRTFFEPPAAPETGDGMRLGGYI